MGQDLDLDLVEPPLGVPGLDVDDAELVVEEFALVIGIEDLDRADRRRQLGAQQGVEEVYQEGAVVFGPQQGFEDAVDLGVDGVAHDEKSSTGGGGACLIGPQPGENSMGRLVLVTPGLSTVRMFQVAMRSA